MPFGTLAHTVGRKPLKELTQELSGYSIDFVQLALSKAISDIDTGLGRLSPGLASHVGEQFDRAGIRIGVLGCYIDLVHPDPAQRRLEVARFKEHIRFAHYLGTPTVATETGSLLTYREHDAERYREIGWEVARTVVEELAEEAEKWGVHVGIEPVVSHTISDPHRMQWLLEAVPSSNLGVVFDPCNLLDRANVGDQEKIVDDAFSLFGDRIVLVHLKDLIEGDGGEGRPITVRAGAANGLFDVPGFLDKLHRHKPFIDISLEGVDGGNLEDTLQYLRGLPAIANA